MHKVEKYILIENMSFISRRKSKYPPVAFTIKPAIAFSTAVTPCWVHIKLVFITYKWQL